MRRDAGNRLASLASLSYTQFATSVKGAALLAAGTDDLVCVYRVTADKRVSPAQSCMQNACPIAYQSDAPATSHMLYIALMPWACFRWHAS